MYNQYLEAIKTRLDEVPTEVWDTEPFGNLVLDNFLPENLAKELKESLQAVFRDNPEMWNAYNNPLENKLVFNRWDKLPKPIYSFFLALGDPAVAQRISELTLIDNLVPDAGLHGGGIHMHKRGGKLNVHQDYSIHPKTDLQRRLNIILYLNPVWDPAWGGGLGLYTHDEVNDQPADLVKVIDCVWNRAVLFDTAPGSWHGLPDPIGCPDDVQRTSLAYYYVRTPVVDAPQRGAVRFAPSEEQRGNADIEDLIKLRSNPETAKMFYKNTN